MKRIISAALFTFLLVIASCSMGEDEFRSNGTITGYDTRECVCCGGYFIDIDKATYRFFDLPRNSNIDLDSATFPIYVKLDWAIDPNACLGDEIIVSRIEKR
jgi:hypothetical protein